MTLLLPRVEAVLGPIERWPRTVLDQLFNDPLQKRLSATSLPSATATGCLTIWPISCLTLVIPW